MKNLQLFCVFLAISFFVSNKSVQAQNATVHFTIEQSTDGLQSWQSIPVTPQLINNGNLSVNTRSPNVFYRIKINNVTPFLPVSGMVTIQGGTLVTSNELNGIAVSNFLIGKYEVTWGEWQDVRSWAAANGYDLDNVGSGSDSNHPVKEVNWYHAAKWCNAKSEKDGLVPVYQQSGAAIYKAGQFKPFVNTSANGYRLPTQAEWEWAARGGLSSKGYIHSGSDDLNTVGWYSGNAGGGTRVIAQKVANELGIYDMSGNVAEWCWDLYSYTSSCIRGGSWQDNAGSCTVDYHNIINRPDLFYNNRGFRLARSSGN